MRDAERAMTETFTCEMCGGRYRGFRDLEQAQQSHEKMCPGDFREFREKMKRGTDTDRRSA